ncbi:MAG: hypothetical protein AMXMBFR84_26500 [Candidatus Hydrogenedentota bacterium]
MNGNWPGNFTQDAFRSRIDDAHSEHRSVLRLVIAAVLPIGILVGYNWTGKSNIISAVFLLTVITILSPRYILNPVFVYAIGLAAVVRSFWRILTGNTPDWPNLSMFASPFDAGPIDNAHGTETEKLYGLLSHERGFSIRLVLIVALLLGGFIGFTWADWLSSQNENYLLFGYLTAAIFFVMRQRTRIDFAKGIALLVISRRFIVGTLAISGVLVSIGLFIVIAALIVGRAFPSTRSAEEPPEINLSPDDLLHDPEFHLRVEAAEREWYTSPDTGERACRLQLAISNSGDQTAETASVLVQLLDNSNSVVATKRYAVADPSRPEKAIPARSIAFYDVDVTELLLRNEFGSFLVKMDW